MRALLLACVVLASCKHDASAGPGPTTSLGPIGEVDFTKRLPENVKVNDQQATHEGTQTICKRTGAAGADIKVRWKTFQNNKDTYFGNAQFELTRVEDGLSVALQGDKPMVGGSNLHAGGPYRALAQVYFTCRQAAKNGYVGGGLVVFDTEGNVVPPPSE